MSNFDSAFTFVVGAEGGYVNDPNDPGGETKYGISKRAYPNEDIPNLSLERAKALYLRDYWTPAGCDSLPWDRALMVFDAAVNQGLSFAKTLAGHVEDMAAARGLRYAGAGKFILYGKGWLRRLALTTMRTQQLP